LTVYKVATFQEKPVIGELENDHGKLGISVKNQGKSGTSWSLCGPGKLSKY